MAKLFKNGAKEFSYDSETKTLMISKVGLGTKNWLTSTGNNISVKHILFSGDVNDFKSFDFSVYPNVKTITSLKHLHIDPESYRGLYNLNRIYIPHK